MERTLVLCKPDAVQRGLVGTIIKTFEERGLKIVGMKMVWMDKEMARKHYAEHVGKPFYPALEEFITSSPLVAMVLEGEGVVEVVRNMMGATDPKKADNASIRGRYALTIDRNLIHGSDSEESAKREIALFFDEKELFDYKLTMDKHIYG